MERYKILKVLSIKEGLALIDLSKTKKRGKAKINIEGYVFSVNTDKLKTYLLKGCFCDRCNKPGQFFAITECSGSVALVLELFRIENHELISYTCDHIIPISCNGRKHSLGNMQTMCYLCNQDKGNKRK